MDINILYFFIGMICGGITMFFVAEMPQRIICKIQNIVHKVRNKFLPDADKEMDSLSIDTQIILKQYMRSINYYGHKIYAVENVKLFDMLLCSHRFQEINDSFEKSYEEFYESLKECLAEGSGFIILCNGKEYIAVPAPVGINPDGSVD